MIMGAPDGIVRLALPRCCPLSASEIPVSDPAFPALDPAYAFAIAVSSKEEVSGNGTKWWVRSVPASIEQNLIPSKTRSETNNDFN